MESLTESYLKYLEEKEGNVKLNEFIVLGAVVAYKLYKRLTDKCLKSCKKAGYRKVELSLCRSKCNITNASKAIKNLEQTRSTLLSQTKDDKIKAKINKKIEKKVNFFKNKIDNQARMAQAYELKLKQEKQKK
jgi:hypothetical protein